MPKQEQSYLVVQRPKPRFAGHLTTCVMVVTATSKAEAVRKAVEKGDTGGEKWFHPNHEYCATYAELLRLDHVYGF